MSNSVHGTAGAHGAVSEVRSEYITRRRGDWYSVKVIVSPSGPMSQSRWVLVFRNSVTSVGVPNGELVSGRVATNSELLLPDGLPQPVL